MYDAMRKYSHEKIPLPHRLATTEVEGGVFSRGIQLMRSDAYICFSIPIDSQVSEMRSLLVKIIV